MKIRPLVITGDRERVYELLWDYRNYQGLDAYVDGAQLIVRPRLNRTNLERYAR